MFQNLQDCCAHYQAACIHKSIETCCQENELIQEDLYFSTQPRELYSESTRTSVTNSDCHYQRFFDQQENTRHRKGWTIFLSFIRARVIVCLLNNLQLKGKVEKMVQDIPVYFYLHSPNANILSHLLIILSSSSLSMNLSIFLLRCLRVSCIYQHAFPKTRSYILP